MCASMPHAPRPSRRASDRASVVNRTRPRWVNSRPRLSRPPAGLSSSRRRRPVSHNWRTTWDGVPTHFHRVFKAITGLTPKEYAAAHRAKRVRSTLGTRGTVTEAIYDAGYNSNGRFYATANEVLGMTPSNYRAGGAQYSHTLRRGRMFARVHPRRPERARNLRHSAGRRSRRTGARVTGPVPAGHADRRRRRLRAARRDSGGFCRSAGSGAGPAARYPGHCLPTARLASTAKIPAGSTAAIPTSPNASVRRRPVRAVAQACGCQPPGRGDPVPSCGTP